MKLESHDEEVEIDSGEETPEEIVTDRRETIEESPDYCETDKESVITDLDEYVEDNEPNDNETGD